MWVGTQRKKAARFDIQDLNSTTSCMSIQKKAPISSVGFPSWCARYTSIAAFKKAKLYLLG